MLREPTRIGPPHCWGRYKAVAECDSCPFRKSCERTTDEWSNRKTVAEAAADVIDTAYRTAAREVDVETILSFAFSRYRRAGGREFPVWLHDQGFMRAMASVKSACAKSGADPLVYVTAQVSWLSPMIKKGIPLKPGHFVGDGADSRFLQWSRSKARNSGNATTLAEDRQDREKRQIAACVYAEYRIHRRGHDLALTRARDYYATFDPKNMTPAQRVIALFDALLSLDPAVPRMLLMPAGDWTWDDAEQAVTALTLPG